VRNYAELHCASAFSFLDGSALPEDLVDAAIDRGLPAMALCDVNGVYGAPRFYKAARSAGLKALVGAEVAVENLSPRGRGRPAQPSLIMNAGRERGTETAGETPLPNPPPQGGRGRLTLLVQNRIGYRNLSRLLTAAASGKPKGQAFATWDQLALHSEGLICLTGGDEGLVAKALSVVPANDAGTASPLERARRLLERLHALYPGRVKVELQRHRRRDEEFRNRALIDLARPLKLPIIATNGVKYARPQGKDLFDVLTCIRLGTNLDAGRGRLHVNRERHVKTAAEMIELFRDRPEAIEETMATVDQMPFTLADLGYRFPDYPVPPADTLSTYLRRVTWEAAEKRFQPLHEKARAQIEKELAMIEKLDLPGYFLIVWDIINFCRREKIMVQGRGSAANSAVCYALGITAVDPVKMELLFERFLSEERGEWPDIDLDLPSGAQREKVIQYVYSHYGAQSAAMTANVITYRPKSAAREVGKAFGLSLDQVGKLSLHLGHLELDEIRANPKSIAERLSAAGLDPRDPRMRKMAKMWLRMLNLPRHLGQHSGGMVMAHGRLDEIVPIEPAAMEGRAVVQWDKEDCADLGLIKVDLLGLGMLQALEECLPMILKHEKITVDLAHLPQDDPAVFRMLRAADTVGLFQVESRAQMASLPRNAPMTFYDIVVQVAIIRPGPIQGGMVKPFFDRRQGRAPVEYPHPCLEPILKRTLGVPLFQEQVIKMGMVAAGFTGGEAEELRRAMGFKRSVERMDSIEKRLRAGMTKNGINGPAQDMIVKTITSFALYGFPESHAASFALIVYASAYLKCHHPAAFYACLLNAWPMGFYHPATIVKDAQRHGVEVRPIDVNRSLWGCDWEACHREEAAADSLSLGGRGLGRGGTDDDEELHWSNPSPRPSPSRGEGQAFRLGLRFVKGLKETTGRRIDDERARKSFKNSADLAARCHLSADDLTRLAHAGALSCFGLTRREALWQVAKVGRSEGPLFMGQAAENESPLPEMDGEEETIADYLTSEVTTGPHLLAHYRDRLRADNVKSATELMAMKEGAYVRTAGAVIVRQHPMTAKGFVFLTMEDETGMVQAIVSPDLFRHNRALIVGNGVLIVEGNLQHGGGQISVRADHFASIESPVGIVRSHDFH